MIPVHTAAENLTRSKIQSPAAHKSRNVKGIMRITFSKHSVVRTAFPLESVFQIHQPSITLDSGLSHRLRFSKVRNKIMAVQNTSKNNLRKLAEPANSRSQARAARRIPFPAPTGR